MATFIKFPCGCDNNTDVHTNDTKLFCTLTLSEDEKRIASMYTDSSMRFEALQDMYNAAERENPKQFVVFCRSEKGYYFLDAFGKVFSRRAAILWMAKIKQHGYDVHVASITTAQQLHMKTCKKS